MLESLFQNDMVKKLAFGQLKKIMEEGKLTLIALSLDASGMDGPLPGFRVEMFKVPVTIFPDPIVAIYPEQWEDYKKLHEAREKANNILDPFEVVVQKADYDELVDFARNFGAMFETFKMERRAQSIPYKTPENGDITAD